MGVDVKEQIASEALGIVNGARREAYGSPELNFHRIARLWTAHMINLGLLVPGEFIHPEDVALMIDLMKTARLAESPGHRDSIVDKVGYALCYAEVVLPSVTVEDNPNVHWIDWPATEDDARKQVAE